MFSSYIENPENYRFEGQDPDETILLLLRAHPVTNYPWVLFAIFVALLPVILPSFLGIFGETMPNLPGEYYAAFLLVNYLLVLAVIFEGFLSWYFNVHIITERKLIDVDFHSLLYKNIDLTPITEIQETNSRTLGLLGMVFNFGDVYVQTAGAQVAIDFDKVPYPNRVADMIMDLAHKS